MAPGPPPGEPLLDANAAQNLNTFFTEFDTNNLDPHSRALDGPQFHDGKDINFELPPDFVGSGTSLGPRYGPSVDPQDLQPVFYSDGLMSAHVPLIPHGTSFAGTMQTAGPGYINPSYSNQMQSHFPSLLDPQFHQQWLPGYQIGTNAPMTNGRPQVRFGSDELFHASGYAAPPNHQEPDVMRNLDWIEAQSSATNTQPNTQPNTTPSSPIVSRKRKHVDEQSLMTEPLISRTGLLARSQNMMAEQLLSPEGKTSTRKLRQPDIKEEASTAPTVPQPGPWPISKPHAVSKPSPAKRPSNRSKRKAPPSPEPAPSSSRSKATKTSNKAQTKTKLSSKGTKQSSRSSTTPGGHRQPLTQAEKKANHTNSEQRRRDATSRAYAEMYDLVPELESMGKLSTTKKLECVVKKVRELKDGNATLERMLGLE
jgi:hypothetical protein